MSTNKNILIKKIRLLILLFMFSLIISGITAFPIEMELRILNDHVYFFPDFVKEWISKVYLAVQTTNANYPYLSYGTDWLAYAHLAIAVAFIGPLKNPVKNIWVIQFGMIACIMIFPLAFIAGPIRTIPFYWQLIDCSFGFIGFILLFIIYRFIKKLESIA
jgi:hypothetical protein